MNDDAPVSGADADPGTDTGIAPARPVLRVIRGGPTDEELAALVAVLAAAGAAASTQPPRSAESTRSTPKVGRWSDPSRRFRTQLRTGPGAWRASGGPAG